MNAYFIFVFAHVQMWCLCAQPYVDQTKKFLIVLFAFGSDLYHSCFSKFFKLILCEKNVFWVFSRVILRVSSVTKFGQSVSRVFLKKGLPTSYPRKFSVTSENFQISFLKGISWDICFKLLSSSPKPLFLCLHIKTQLHSTIFYPINISKVIFNSFYWFWSLDYVFGGFYIHSWNFLKWGLENLIFVNLFDWVLF